MKFVQKYYLALLALLTSVVCVAYYQHVYNTDEHKTVDQFNQTLLNKQEELDRFLAYRVNDLESNDHDQLWEQGKQSDFSLHVFKNDSLKYWNTIQMPVLRFENIHFPAQGVLHLQNGWYYTKIKRVNEYTVCAGFLIKRDYSYENKDLINTFSEEFNIPFEGEITIAEDEGIPVFGSNKDYLFSILPAEHLSIERARGNTLFVILTLSVILWLFWFVKINQSVRPNYRWVLPLTVLLVRAMSLKFSWFDFMVGTECYQPEVFGLSTVFPNFLEFVINLSVISYLMHALISWIKSSNTEKVWLRSVLFLLLIGSLSLFELLLYLIRGMIENTTISFEVGALFELNLFSILGITGLGVLFLSLVKFQLALFKKIAEHQIKATFIAVLLFITGAGYLLYEIIAGTQVLVIAVFPLILFSVVGLMAYQREKKKPLAFGLTLLLLFSGLSSLTIQEFNARNEKAEREVLANQLADEQNMLTEVNYNELSEELQQDNFLTKFISTPIKMSFSDFQENMERRFFNGYWERYEMSFFLFDSTYQSLLRREEASPVGYPYFQKLIEEAGVVSEIDSSIYYITDFSDHYSYVIKQEIKGKEGETGYLICTLKSKKIPEEIGFPRLLISDEANVIESLEHYSIAKYRSGKLLTHYGDFEYPSESWILNNLSVSDAGFVDFAEYNHYLLNRSELEQIVLSKKIPGALEKLTSFSYLFCFYGILLFPMMFRLNTSGSSTLMNLSLKIRIVLFGLVFLSLLAFGLGSGTFVKNQYSEFTNNAIREKLNSVQSEVKAKLGAFDKLTIEDDGDYIEYLLKKFSGVFFTDINLYDTNGYLLGTSRPKVFNIGLISDQMNPVAFSNLKYRKKSSFVNNETIGTLNYSSAYQPFYNAEGQHLAYINLQHFGQQNAIENQIQQFLVAIINVFILLLAVTLILAIFISNWLTEPLHILQESFSKVKFGQHNQRILYSKNDEIGALVKEYNQKLDELEYNAAMLAKNERESAWREMAKQVAHEIKNPLTPMKLSVQQLLRVYDPNDENSKDKLEKVANSIIAQIDALSNIANEFSNFAKLPQPNEQEIDVFELVKSVKEVFENEDQIKISVTSNANSCMVRGDKDQLMRVFNNLMKNSIQAIPEGREGIIEIDLHMGEDKLRISFKDNGSGISKSMRSRLFVPYFTTKSTGTGLGLAMVKQIIENHNGTISVETAENEGTTFFIELPCSVSRGSTPQS